ncbi:YitT family protein [Microvirga brassicacearum]|uniref:YitT family protein n=1 Tax=Microvirga brassicacearum TaxID=2580413 RepID=A0A5N3PAP7_9HYPH|nr:YitT family protein [Microvirga brassicacearum]KAB0266822.1 YitT family protein [Microvirga brassicacearum]
MTNEKIGGPTHRAHEDVAALLTGTLIVALGVTLYSKAVLLTGGTAGLALLLQYATGFEFGPLFFAINLPFYYLAVRRMGRKLTIRTFLAVLLVSVFSNLTPSWVGIDHLNPAYAAIIGGALMGVGLLILFRHRTSLGGINILALYIQERYGIRAGYVQLGIDALILLAAFSVLDFDRVALSLVGAAVLNLILATNHRPGRYTGVS